MATCSTCGREVSGSFEIRTHDDGQIFDSFECAIHRPAFTSMPPIAADPRREQRLKRESGRIGWALLWLLGVPLPVLLVLFAARGCT